MIRYSESKRNKPGGPTRKSATGAELFAEIVESTSELDRRGGLLLLGGTSARDVKIRQAQASLRYDRLPSYWSQAALILDWPDGAEPNEVIGAEVALEPEDCREQVPERNGVTYFRLDRYLDRDPYPNIAFGTWCLSERSEEKDEGPERLSENRIEELKDQIVDAALNPARDRMRFPLWEWLGQWQAYLHAAEAVSPISQGIAHPGAALCEYAYEAAGIDVTPGATAPNACPEHFWNTLLHWNEPWRRRGVDIRVWRLVAKDEAPTRKPKRIGYRKLSDLRKELE